MNGSVSSTLLDGYVNIAEAEVILHPKIKENEDVNQFKDKWLCSLLAKLRCRYMVSTASKLRTYPPAVYGPRN